MDHRMSLPATVPNYYGEELPPPVPAPMMMPEEHMPHYEMAMRGGYEEYHDHTPLQYVPNPEQIHQLQQMQNIQVETPYTFFFDDSESRM
jgi:hypothetical protein